jgi:hypothetical protein
MRVLFGPTYQIPARWPRRAGAGYHLPAAEGQYNRSMPKTPGSTRAAPRKKVGETTAVTHLSHPVGWGAYGKPTNGIYIYAET